MKIEFLENAQTELDQAFEWYETQQKNLGIQFLNEFDAAIIESEVNKATSFPRSVVGMPEYRSSGTGRRSVPYCIPTPERGNDNESIQTLRRYINSRLYRRIISYPESYIFILIEKSVRRCLHFPYGILYDIDVGKIIIVAVAHLHRKPDYWIDRA